MNIIKKSAYKTILGYKSFIIIVFRLVIILICTVTLNMFFFLVGSSKKEISSVSALLALLVFIIHYIISSNIKIKKGITNIALFIRSKGVFRLLLLAFLLQSTKLLIIYLINNYISISINNDLDNFLYGNIYRIIDYFNMILLGPIVEEVIFRKTLYTSLKNIYKNRNSNLIQSFIFGLFHFSLIGFAFNFILGYVLGVIYHKEKTIIAPIILHGFHNVFGIIILNYL